MNEPLVNRVRAVLGGTRNVTEKRMFGGVAFLVQGKLCVCVGSHRILLRVDPALHDALVQKPGASTMTMRGREYRGYLVVSEAALKKQARLEHWVRFALDFNPRAQASKKAGASRRVAGRGATAAPRPRTT